MKLESKVTWNSGVMYSIRWSSDFRFTRIKLLQGAPFRWMMYRKPSISARTHLMRSAMNGIVNVLLVVVQFVCRYKRCLEYDSFHSIIQITQQLQAYIAAHSLDLLAMTRTNCDIPHLEMKPRMMRLAMHLLPLREKALSETMYNYINR